jgi:hypothetical protein
MNEYFSWLEWVMSFLPENTKKRKAAIYMIVGIISLQVSIWFSSFLIALMSLNSWAVIPTIITGVMFGIAGVIIFIIGLTNL